MVALLVHGPLIGPLTVAVVAAAAAAAKVAAAATVSLHGPVEEQYFMVATACTAVATPCAVVLTLQFCLAHKVGIPAKQRCLDSASQTESTACGPFYADMLRWPSAVGDLKAPRMASNCGFS